MTEIDFEKLFEVDFYARTLAEDQSDFRNMLEEAKSEISFYDWCIDIVESYVGIYRAGIVGIFLFKIEPADTSIGEYFWVIVGDLPSIYITIDESPNAACALDSYIGAMEEWVIAADSGEFIADLVPVNVPATKENAKKLKVRLTMLDENILSEYQDDLK